MELGAENNPPLSPSMPWLPMTQRIDAPYGFGMVCPLPRSTDICTSFWCSAYKCLAACSPLPLAGEGRFNTPALAMGLVQTETSGIEAIDIRMGSPSPHPSPASGRGRNTRPMPNCPPDGACGTKMLCKTRLAGSLHLGLRGDKHLPSSSQRAAHQPSTSCPAPPSTRSRSAASWSRVRAACSNSRFLACWSICFSSRLISLDKSFSATSSA